MAPSEASEEQLNARVFAEHQLLPWSEILAESERVYAELLTVTEQLSEADLTASHRFTLGWPLYAIFLGSCYEHDQEHLAQYYSDRHDLPRAMQLCEQCADRVMQAEVPAWVKGSFLYNLACFYAQQHQLERAAVHLQEAVTLAPRLQERAKSDPELGTLRDPSA